MKWVIRKKLMLLILINGGSGRSGGLEKHRKINKRGDVYIELESKREEGI